MQENRGRERVEENALDTARRQLLFGEQAAGEHGPASSSTHSAGAIVLVSSANPPATCGVAFEVRKEHFFSPLAPKYQVLDRSGARLPRDPGPGLPGSRRRPAARSRRD